MVVRALISVLVLSACAIGRDSTPTTTIDDESTTTSVAGLPGPGQALAPGEYRGGDLSPSVGFTVDDGWAVGYQTDGLLEIVNRDGTTIAFIGDSTSSDEILESVVARVSLLGESPSLMDDRVGVVIEVENVTSEEVPLLQAARLDPGHRAWMALFEVDGETLVILVEGRAADWDRALATAEPVLETVEIAA
jgi:hypothetical protein